MQLNELADNIGARQNRMRVGRGIGSGKGKTCGRGVKGQKSRTGVAIKGFEGGQMPIHRRLPKRGFNNHSRIEYAVINLSSLQAAIDNKKLDVKKEINRESLIESGLVSSSDRLVKLLANGELKSKVKIAVNKASAKATELVGKAGGSVEIIEFVKKSSNNNKPAKAKKSDTKKS